MYNFCTLFDSNYLIKGLTLYTSLKSVCDDFHLYIFAFDDQCYNKLLTLNLSNVTVIALSEFETQELLNVKVSRNKAEYCWTCGPSAIWYAINYFKLNSCTYLDADLYFFNPVDSLFEEINGASVAITRHFNDDELGGNYCVQFVYFKNDTDGISALKWWKDCCIDWCYSRFEDGKYGDQKYLDEFTVRFKNVHVVLNRGAGVAPWNMDQYKFPEYGKFVFEGNKYSIIFYHYHGIRIDLKDNILSLKAITYDIGKSIKSFIYIPYLKSIQTNCVKLLNINVLKICIQKRSLKEKAWSFLKRSLRKSKIAQYLYYKIFNVRYNGYERKAII